MKNDLLSGIGIVEGYNIRVVWTEGLLLFHLCLGGPINLDIFVYSCCVSVFVIHQLEIERFILEGYRFRYSKITSFRHCYVFCQARVIMA